MTAAEAAAKGARSASGVSGGAASQFVLGVTISIPSSRAVRTSDATGERASLSTLTAGS